jgi:glycosyltransferase involved in cell wall biosynthesis
MSEQILLSVVVPMASMSGRLANFKSWIKNCERHSIEIILVQDGLDEATLSEVGKILSECTLLNHKVISGNFGSAGTARNAGLDKVTGKWIAFWDSDDQVIVDEFISMVTLADSRDLEAVIGNFEIVSEINGKTIEPLGWGSQSLEVLAKMPGLWRMAFKRDLIFGTKFRTFRVAEDHHFLTDIDFQETRYEWYRSTVYRYFTGGQSHVTRDAQALQDLLLAATQMRHQIRLKTGGQTLSYLFLIREGISTFKYCSVQSKYLLVKKAFKFLFYSSSKEKKNLVKTMYGILGTETGIRIDRRFQNTTTVILVGGLGNQLFQTVAALTIAGSNSVKIETSFLSLEKKKIGLSEINFYTLPSNASLINSQNFQVITKKVVSYCLRLSVIQTGIEKLKVWRSLTCLLTSVYFTLYYKKISVVKISSGIGFSKVKKSRFNSVLIGYFQSYLWHDQLAFVKPGYELSLKNEPEIIDQYSKFALEEKPLVMHLRFGDYLSESKFGTLPRSYFQSAYDLISEDKKPRKIWVFSDDIAMAKDYLPSELHRIVRWIGDLDGRASTSLEIMRLGEAYVISNSTFGWWGAKLSRASQAKVIAPSPWFQSRTSPKDLLPPSWDAMQVWG